jgi:hypothetical protein
MSASSNYNAITNLTETVIDYLVVDTAEIDTALIENLDCNVGTIDTFTSTTSTITSANIPTLTTTTANITTENTTTANITTANITSLNANSIQANPVSSAVSLYTTGTGALTLGNTSNTNPLTINNNTTIGTGKKITTPDILISSLTASKIVLTDASKNLLSSAYDTTTLPVSTPTQTALDLKSNIANPTFTTGITTPLLTFNGIQTASKLLLTNASKVVISSAYDETTLPVSTPQQTALDLKSNIANPTFTTGLTTPLLTFNGVQTASKLLLTNASKVVISSAYTDSDFVLKSGSSISGTLNVNDIQGTTTSSSITLYTNSSVSSPTISLGNVSGGTFTINPNTQLNGTLTLAASKNLTLSSTGNLIGNTLQGTAITSAISLYGNIVAGSIALGTSLTGSMNIGTSMRNGILTIGSASFNSATDTGYAVIHLPVYFNQDLNITTGKNIVMASTGLIKSETHTGLSTISAFNLGESADSGGINCNRTMTFANNKNIVMNSTGIISVDTINATATTISPNIYTNLTDPFSVITIGNSAISGVLFNSDLSVNAGKSLVSNSLSSRGSSDLNINTLSSGYFINLQQDVKIASNKTLLLQGTGGITLSTGTITANTFQGTSAGSNINLFTSTTGTITVGTTSSASTFNGDVYVGTSANNKGIVCNYLSTYATSGTMRISPIFTTGSIQIGDSQSTGNITLGHTTPASDSGTLTINKNTTLASNKNLTLGNQSKLVGGSNGSVNITAVAYTNVAVISASSLAGFYQVFIYGASATQTYSVCCFLSADNSGAIQTTASRNMTFQFSAPNYTITATVVPTSTISMGYNIVRLF